MRKSMITGLCLILLPALSAGGTASAATAIDAELIWAQQVRLGTPVKGVIERIEVEAGQQVAAGQLLLQLDQRPFLTRIQARRAQLRKLAAVRAEARREWERAQELYDRTVLSDHELQVAKDAWIGADADYRQAQADLKSAQLELEYSSLKAPFAARVLRRDAEVGETVVPELQPAVLLVLADSTRMRARARIGAQQLAGLKIGTAVKVTSQGRTFAAHIASLSLEPQRTAAQAPRYLLEAEFPAADARLLAGQAAEIILP